MEENKEIRKKIREALFSMDKDIKEQELLKNSSWEESKKVLKDDLKELLKHIEEDKYEKGVEKIDHVITSLKKWKSRLQNRLNNNN